MTHVGQTSTYGAERVRRETLALSPFYGHAASAARFASKSRSENGAGSSPADATAVRPAREHLPSRLAPGHPAARGSFPDTTFSWLAIGRHSSSSSKHHVEPHFCVGRRC